MLDFIIANSLQISIASGFMIGCVHTIINHSTKDRVKYLDISKKVIEINKIRKKINAQTEKANKPFFN